MTNRLLSYKWVKIIVSGSIFHPNQFSGHGLIYQILKSVEKVYVICGFTDILVYITFIFFQSSVKS